VRFVFDLSHDFPTVGLLCLSPLGPYVVVHDAPTKHNKGATVPQHVYGLDRKPLGPQLAVGRQPVCYLCWRRTHVAQIGLNVDSALVPERETMVVKFRERVFPQKLGGIR